jgi:hypothetical protein
MPNATIEGNRYEVYSNRDRVHTTLALAEFPEIAQFKYDSASCGALLTVVSHAILDYLGENHKPPTVSEFTADDVKPFMEWHDKDGRQIVFCPTDSNGVIQERPLDTTDVEPFIGTRYGLGLR